MLGENVIQADFRSKEISDYVCSGECATAKRGALYSETNRNVVVGIHDQKNRKVGLANINNISELEKFAEEIRGSAKLVGPAEKIEEARKYLVGKGFSIDYFCNGEWLVKIDAKTGCIELETAGDIFLTERSGSADNLY